MNNPKVTIIVPIYKVEKYLERCVDSILAQTFTDYELILVDDGSPDTCGDIAEEYAKKDSRIKVIHKKNGGLSDARNVAIDIAAGEYISFIDSDDWIEPDMIESMYNVLVNTDSDIVACGIEEFYDDGTTRVIYNPRVKVDSVEGQQKNETFVQPCACNKMYRRFIFDKIRFPLGRLYEDAFIYHHILRQAKRFAYTGKISYHYYIRSTSIMQMKYTLRSTDIIEAVYDRAKTLDEQGYREDANTADLFIYSRLSLAYCELDTKIPENKTRLRSLKKLYDERFMLMFSSKYNNVKQKLRLLFLYISPWLHTKIYRKKQVDINE